MPVHIGERSQTAGTVSPKEDSGETSCILEHYQADWIGEAADDVKQKLTSPPVVPRDWPFRRQSRTARVNSKSDGGAGGCGEGALKHRMKKFKRWQS